MVVPRMWKNLVNDNSVVEERLLVIPKMINFVISKSTLFLETLRRKRESALDDVRSRDFLNRPKPWRGSLRPTSSRSDKQRLLGVWTSDVRVSEAKKTRCKWWRRLSGTSGTTIQLQSWSCYLTRLLKAALPALHNVSSISVQICVVMASLFGRLGYLRLAASHDFNMTVF